MDKKTTEGQKRELTLDERRMMVGERAALVNRFMIITNHGLVRITFAEGYEDLHTLPESRGSVVMSAEDALALLGLLQTLVVPAAPKLP